MTNASIVEVTVTVEVMREVSAGMAVEEDGVERAKSARTKVTKTVAEVESRMMVLYDGSFAEQRQWCCSAHGFGLTALELLAELEIFFVDAVLIAILGPSRLARDPICLIVHSRIEVTKRPHLLLYWS